LIVILDTGADINYMPFEMAEYFETLLSKKTSIISGAEAEFKCRTTTILLKIENPHKAYRKRLTFNVPTEPGLVNNIILGTDFLMDFILTLDYKKGTINLKENQAQYDLKKKKYIR